MASKNAFRLFRNRAVVALNKGDLAEARVAVAAMLGTMPMNDTEHYELAHEVVTALPTADRETIENFKFRIEVNVLAD